MQFLQTVHLLASLAGLVAAQSDPRDPTTPIKATMNYYGSADGRSGTCQTNQVACGFYTTGSYQYYAAISQYYYGCGPGQGACHGCSNCWLVTPQNDSSGNPLRGAHSIVVKINNVCASNDDPLCHQSNSNDVNQYGGRVNIKTCYDPGATQALFGTSGATLAVGCAEEVDCASWGKPYSGPPLTCGLAATGTSSGCSPLYSQCAKQSYTGTTCCPSGSTCQYQNQYYSQYLPPQKLRFARD